MDLKKTFKGLFEDSEAVSPIVATLVLVVVAIAGAAAVGTIMGSFSSDVSDQASTGQIADSAATELLVAGSSTVYPVSVILAEDYMAENPGIKINVQSSGSGAGVAGAGMGIVDIGAASRSPKTEELEKYPDLQVHQVGASAVVFISSTDVPKANFTKDAIKQIYSLANEDGKVDFAATAFDDGNISDTEVIEGTTYTVLQRDESSGTEDCFAKYIGGSSEWIDENSDAVKTKGGNAGVLKAVEGGTMTLAFVDFGFADGDDDVHMQGVEGCAHADVTEANVLAAITGDTTTFPDGLTRPLNYLTNGNPTSIQKDFIDFARSPLNSEAYEEVGYFPFEDL